MTNVSTLSVKIHKIVIFVFIKVTEDIILLNSFMSTLQFKVEKLIFYFLIKKILVDSFSPPGVCFCKISSSFLIHARFWCNSIFEWWFSAVISFKKNIVNSYFTSFITAVWEQGDVHSADPVPGHRDSGSHRQLYPAGRRWITSTEKVSTGRYFIAGSDSKRMFLFLDVTQLKSFLHIHL